jgi:hypothetical protein
MGGMFSVLKVRKEQKPGDYANPGWYAQPSGEVAFEWTGALPDPARFAAEGQASMPVRDMPAKNIEVRVRKPAANASSHDKH